MMSAIDLNAVCGYVIHMVCGVHARPQRNPLKPAMYTLGFSVSACLALGAQQPEQKKQSVNPSATKSTPPHFEAAAQQ